MKNKGRKPNPDREKARLFVGNGNLRACLERDGELSIEQINYIIDACSFVLKV